MVIKKVFLSIFSALLLPIACCGMQQRTFMSAKSAEVKFQRDLSRALAASKRQPQPKAVTTIRTSSTKPATRAPLAKNSKAPIRNNAPKPQSVIHDVKWSDHDLQQAIANSLAETRKKSYNDTQNDADYAFALELDAENKLYPAASPAPKKATVKAVKPTSSSHMAQYAAQKEIPVTHFRTNQQSGLECGFRAVTNGKAIENIITRGQALNEQTLKTEELRVYRHERSKASITQNLTIDNVGTAAQKLGMANLYPLGIDKDGVIYSPGNGDISIDQACRILKDAPQGILHFVINTGGHWVVLTLIKQREANYRIIHVDSMNGTVNARVQPYIDYINYSIV